jgi:hypothetical protein
MYHAIDAPISHLASQHRMAIASQKFYLIGHICHVLSVRQVRAGIQDALVERKRRGGPEEGWFLQPRELL